MQMNAKQIKHSIQFNSVFNPETFSISSLEKPFIYILFIWLICMSQLTLSMLKTIYPAIANEQ